MNFHQPFEREEFSLQTSENTSKPFLRIMHLTGRLRVSNEQSLEGAMCIKLHFCKFIQILMVSYNFNNSQGF